MTRSAKSLLELIVALAILAVLVGLVLSAVAKVRDAATRMHCQSRMKQIGLSFQLYEGTHGVLPPGAIRGPWKELDIPADVDHGFGVFILPHMEQEIIFRNYSLQHTYFDVKNNIAIQNRIILFQCPALGPEDRYEVLENGHRAGVMDYAPLHLSAFLVDEGVIQPLAKYDGVLPTNYRTKITEIHDGTDNTILLGEASPRGYGTAWASPLNRVEIRGGGSGALSPRSIFSQHHAVANVVMCSGSVRVINRNVDLAVLAAMVTPAAGD